MRILTCDITNAKQLNALESQILTGPVVLCCGTKIM